MNARDVFTGVGDRLLLIGAAILGGDLLSMQRDIIESQSGVIEAQDAVTKSHEGLIVTITKWKDLEAELVNLHADRVAMLERDASAREAHSGILKGRLEARDSRIERLLALIDALYGEIETLDRERVRQKARIEALEHEADSDE